MKKGVKLVISIILPFLATLFAGSSSSVWYDNLIKPSFNPPGWIFGPVWTILYLLMGISLFLVWTSKSKDKFYAYLFFGVQLFLNALWSILFFTLENPLFSLIEIILLWFFILLTIVYFYKINKTASYLLIPYILWVSFAFILNFSIVYLN